MIGLAIEGVEVDDIGSTAKTLPQFTELWQRMLTGGPLSDPLSHSSGASLLGGLDEGL